MKNKKSKKNKKNNLVSAKRSKEIDSVFSALGLTNLPLYNGAQCLVNGFQKAYKYETENYFYSVSSST